MIMIELKKNKQQLSWVDAETACKLLNISIKTLKNKCYAHQLNYKIIKTGNKSIYYINKDSISEVCKTNNTDTSKSLIKKYSDAPNWAKVQAEKYPLSLLL